MIPGVLSTNCHWNHAVLRAFILGYQPLETQIDVPEERHQPLEMQIAQFCRNMSAIERLASRLHNRDLLNRDYAKDLCRCEEYVMPLRFLVTSISDSSSAAAALWPYDSGWAEAGIVCLTGRRACPW